MSEIDMIMEQCERTTNMSLPLDIWQLIVNFNDSPSDIRSIELTCKAFKHLSRRRTSIDCHVIQWIEASRYPNLTRIKGMITDICEGTFQSKIDNLIVSTENDEDMINETHREILGWIVKYNKKAVRVYSGVVDDRYSTREMMYLWTEKSLVFQGCIGDFAGQLTTTYRSVYKDGQIIMYGLPSVDSNEIIEACVIDMLIIKPGYSTVYGDLESSHELWRTVEDIGTKQFVVQCPPHLKATTLWLDEWNKFWTTPPKCQCIISRDEFWTDKGWKLTEAEIKRFGFDDEDGDE